MLCYFYCTQTPNGTSSYHCEIEEEFTEKYGREIEVDASTVEVIYIALE
jgi:hypothetical protein